MTWGASAGTITSEGKYTAPESVPAGGKVTITATTSKGAKAEKTIEITAPVPSVAIEGAPASMTTGSSVQLTAKVSNDSPTVTWGASAGTITTEGKYTAPESVPAGGKVTVTATTSKGAKAEKTIEITPPAGTKGLLVGDATATYTVSDQTTAGREEAFQFTAQSSGTVEELQFRTNATANTGVTGVVLAVFAENAGKPGEVLGSGTASGTPAVSSWIKVTGRFGAGDQRHEVLARRAAARLRQIALQRGEELGRDGQRREHGDGDDQSDGADLLGKLRPGAGRLPGERRDLRREAAVAARAAAATRRREARRTRSLWPARRS